MKMLDRREEENHHIFSSQLRAGQMPGPPREGQLMCTLFLSMRQGRERSALTHVAWHFQASVLPAGTNISATAAVPALLAESSNGPNQCNVGLPTTSALDRYSYIVNFLTSKGLYAVSSLHFEALCQ